MTPDPAPIPASAKVTPLEDRCPDLIETDATVMEFEREALFGKDSRDSKAPLGVALAFSGGGIRSASFGLGVLQALCNAKCFEKFDYLSTVSGGGYLGSAISWLRKIVGPKFTLEFGSAAIGARTCEPTKAAPAAAVESARDSAMNQSIRWLKNVLQPPPAVVPDAAESAEDAPHVWLDFLRQHGNYLKPSTISSLALVGNALRGAIFNLGVYGTVVSGLLACMLKLGLLPVSGEAASGLDGPPLVIGTWSLYVRSASFALLAALLFTASIMLYGIATWLATKSNEFAAALGALLTFGLLAALFVVCGGSYEWPFHRGFHWAESGWGWRWPLALSLGLVALRCLALVADAWGERASAKGSGGRPHATWHYLARVLYQRLLGGALGGLIGVIIVHTLPVVSAWLDAKIGALIAGTSGVGLGGLGAIYQFLSKDKSPGQRGSLADLRIIISALLLIYGSLLLAFGVANTWLEPLEAWPLLAVLGFAIVLGLLINTNYFGIGRMYRDRLMETFMPNLSAIRRNQWEPATVADETALTDFRSPSGGVVRPLHFVNCNVVMVDAAVDKYRNRGGDSFLLSPLFSGSNATGWVATGHFGDGSLSLATAMAISGAAANPRTGVAGRGVTRNRLVSFLMSMVNARLGYWLPNPRRGRRRWLRFAPNLWQPGLQQGLFGRGLDESARYVELTDGGHFDNTALYELIRRRVKVIVLSEGGQDKEYQMDDLANAIEKARVDFGVHIRFDEPRWDLSDLRPKNVRTPAERGYALARIKYPKPGKRGEHPEYETGVLLYMQPTWVKDMRPDTDSYRRRNPIFPNEPTSDQFFNEEQLEAYRELGLRTAKRAIAELAAVPAGASDLIDLLQSSLSLEQAASFMQQAS